MKTIKQIADELGVTKQAVHQKRKSKELSTALQPFTTTVDGVIYIDVDGEKLLKSAFLQTDRKQLDANEPSTVYSDVYADIIPLLKENLVILQQQLAEKDKQIMELTATVKAQAQSINADRHNELAETLQPLIDDKSTVEPTKKNWFNNIFNRNK